MSRKVLNPNQLRMFMRPDEIRSETWPADYDPRLDGPGEEGQINMWREKSSENWISDMDLEVEKEGVKTPVTIMHNNPGWAGDPVGARASGKPLLANGHHRVQAARVAELNKGKAYYVPVVHSDNLPDVKRLAQPDREYRDAKGMDR